MTIHGAVEAIFTLSRPGVQLRYSMDKKLRASVSRPEYVGEDKHSYFCRKSNPVIQPVSDLYQLNIRLAKKSLPSGIRKLCSQLKVTDVSEKYSPPYSGSKCLLANNFKLGSRLSYSLTLKMEIIFFSETSVDFSKHYTALYPTRQNSS
jgi:hypothetical protein